MQIFNLWQIGKLPLGKVFDKSHSEIFAAERFLWLDSWLVEKELLIPIIASNIAFILSWRYRQQTANFMDFLTAILISMKVGHFEICTIVD